MSCPIPEILLTKWKGFRMSILECCYHCDEYDCEHNFNMEDHGLDSESEEVTDDKGRL